MQIYQIHAKWALASFGEKAAVRKQGIGVWDQVAKVLRWDAKTRKVLVQHHQRRARSLDWASPAVGT